MSPAPHEPLGPMPLRTKIVLTLLGIYVLIVIIANGGIGP